MRSLWLVCLVFSFVMATGCEGRPAPPDFSPGEVVRIKVDGQRVMVVELYTQCADWRVRCRVGGPGQVRRDGLFSRDTEITAYQLVSFRPFELDKITSEEARP